MSAVSIDHGNGCRYRAAVGMRRLGERPLARRGVRCIDREVVSETARQFDLHEGEVARREEQTTPFWERMLNGFIIATPEAGCHGSRGLPRLAQSETLMAILKAQLAPDLLRRAVLERSLSTAKGYHDALRSDTRISLIVSCSEVCPRYSLTSGTNRQSTLQPRSNSSKRSALRHQIHSTDWPSTIMRPLE